MNAFKELQEELHQIFVVELREQKRIRAELDIKEKRKQEIFSVLHQKSAEEHRKYMRELKQNMIRLLRVIF